MTACEGLSSGFTGLLAFPLASSSLAPPQPAPAPAAAGGEGAERRRSRIDGDDYLAIDRQAYRSESNPSYFLPSRQIESLFAHLLAADWVVATQNLLDGDSESPTWDHQDLRDYKYLGLPCPFPEDKVT